ncbi:MAG: CsbD family protein [Oligoflexales bacterium]
MNKDIFEGKWNELAGKVKAKWGKLTDDDLDVVGGNVQQLVGKIQERYGWEKDRAEKEIEDFSKDLH